ncbi:MAG: HAD family phosphatase [Patescibacteria group bacterium]
MKAVIFDMDGVLILSEKMHEFLYRKTLQHFGYTLTKQEYNTFFAGRGTLDGFEACFHAKNIPLGDIERYITLYRQLKRDIIHHHLKEHITLREGTSVLLTDLAKKYKLAIATSTIKEFTENLVDAFGFKEYFSVIVCGADVKKGKPDPEIFLKAAEKLLVSPKDCVVIEDAENGVLAAKNAGMVCVALYDAERDLTKADYIVKDFSELKKLLHSI